MSKKYFFPNIAVITCFYIHLINMKYVKPALCECQADK